ncbi:MAG: DNA ligase D [Acidobacteria bacterium]|nr:DNA ligase D [Acidobacteriota bacterium]
MPRRNEPGPELAAYRAKRSADRTPEPFGGDGAAAAPGGGIFVVQQHAARALHWDLRLEIGGVLRSWAVPKGPSPDPADKRLAVETEDHPLEYAAFEGIIPAGNYGAGAMIVWDRGTWVPLDDVAAGLAKGKLLFELRGWKLRGRWTLFRTKQGPRSWMFVKERDGWAGPAAERAFTDDSVISGLTVEELRDGNPRAAVLLDELVRLGAPRRPVAPAAVVPMLAATAEAPFSRDGWIFEIKYDGYRMLAARSAGEALLAYRRGGDATAVFPELAEALAGLPWSNVVLDGEVVVLDEQGRPSFGALQRRVHLSRAADVRRASLELPATLFAFDLLAFGEFDLRGLPLLQRKELLRRVLPSCGPLRYADHVERQGAELFEAVRAMGLEGVVAKRADAPYRSGRSRDWLKVRSDRSADFAVVGYEERSDVPGQVGSLQLALREGERWIYAGSVGSGLREADGEAVRAAPRSAKPVCAGAPSARGTVWLEPRAVAEVRFKEWTRDGLLRQPVFLRLRDDKAPEECAGREPVLPAVPPAPPAPVERQVPFTRLDKVFWPAEGYTKGDLIEYYRAVSPWLLPYLAERPVVLTRYPDGIAGKNFFQKDAPSFAPPWVRTMRLWSEDGRRDIDYFVVDSVEALLYLANLATIPLHVWASRVATLSRPDWCILDLDPKGAPFADVVAVARAVRRLADDIGLPTCVKTSGSSGLHVLVPLGRQCTFEQARTLAEVLARLVAESLPEIATVERRLTARQGRVYIDALQNGHGKLLVAPLSARPRAGATVSMPLRWNEVGPRLDMEAFTIKSAPRRLAKMKADPLREVLDVAPDLTAALERLANRL